jgi:cyclase
MQVDELIVTDIGAANDDYPLDLKQVCRLASEARMPFTYGGGLRSFDDANAVFCCGSEKVLIRWRGNETGNLVESIANRWGSQAVSVSLDVSSRRMLTKQHNGVVPPQKVAEVAHIIQNAGAGEIVVHAIDRDGCRNGYDIFAIRAVAERTNVQLVALGGCGDTSDFRSALEAGATAVAAGSLFVFFENSNSVLLNYPHRMALQPGSRQEICD